MTSLSLGVNLASTCLGVIVCTVHCQPVHAARRCVLAHSLSHASPSRSLVALHSLRRSVPSGRGLPVTAPSSLPQWPSHTTQSSAHRSPATPRDASTPPADISPTVPSAMYESLDDPASIEPVLQVLSVKKVNASGAAATDRYRSVPPSGPKSPLQRPLARAGPSGTVTSLRGLTRASRARSLILSDGDYFAQAMLTTTLNHYVAGDSPEIVKNSIVKLPTYAVNVVQNRRCVRKRGGSATRVFVSRPSSSRLTFLDPLPRPTTASSSSSLSSPSRTTPKRSASPPRSRPRCRRNSSRTAATPRRPPPPPSLLPPPPPPFRRVRWREATRARRLRRRRGGARRSGRAPGARGARERA